eukprot:CAMPEP_0204094244 /NCGR_PEP_ID=MMETSP0360-20130528/190831_1 /ASSEMBLY_ACC=CAM_ASM_000342 /TAXON_ID=268821 /ORGANISM="Scrippsiella Hangoei, Strain SHTV-5" /LENGTH=460 /DNA_ID=CAMNT_0051043553 /DNA_START=32 /DNA_END=1410 /DNA_ORIENTATION=+
MAAAILGMTFGIFVWVEPQGASASALALPYLRFRPSHSSLKTLLRIAGLRKCSADSSRDAQVPEADAELGTTYVSFGQHKDLTYEQVFSQDPGFCQWVVDTAASGKALPALLQLAAWLQGQGLQSRRSPAKDLSTPTGSSKLCCGTYSGKTFVEVLEIDPEYCDYILKAEIPDTESEQGRTFVAFAKWLKTQVLLPLESGPTGTAILSSGKHNGKSYEEVLREDPPYCSWVVSQEKSPDGEIPDTESEQARTFVAFAKWLKTQVRLPSASGSTGTAILSFGKHNGKSYEDVLREDPLYCRWAVSPEGARISMPALLEFSRWVRGQAILDTGKHNGKSYEKVLRDDPQYCRWVVSQDKGLGFRHELREFSGWVPSQELLSYGKNKGKSYEEALRVDPEYCRFTLDQVDKSGYQRRAPFADWLRTHELPRLTGASELPIGKPEPQLHPQSQPQPSVAGQELP